MAKPKKIPVEHYVKTLAARVDLPTSVVKTALELLKKKRLLVGKNPWVWAAALWLASRRKPGLLKALAEAAGSSVVGVRDAARKFLKLTGEAKRRP